jgi:prophage antirepressor-like protein
MELIQFNNTTFIMFGTIEEPYFIGSEIGKILGYARPNDAILNNVWKINKLTYLDYSSTVAHTVGNYNIENIKPTSMLLRKAGLYQLIFTSKLESVKTFEKFITEKLTIQSKPTN